MKLRIAPAHKDADVIDASIATSSREIHPESA